MQNNNQDGMAFHLCNHMVSEWFQPSTHVGGKGWIIFPCSRSKEAAIIHTTICPGEIPCTRGHGGQKPWQCSLPSPSTLHQFIHHPR
jgi:hypothetical protein